MAVRVEKRKLEGLVRAFESGQVGDALLKAVAERGQEIIKNNWSWYVPPRSSPGEPPAIETGTLDKSIEAVRIAVDHWRTRTTVKYGFYLEYGTVKMAARPFVRPAAEVLRKEAPEIGVEVIRRVVRNA